MIALGAVHTNAIHHGSASSRQDADLAIRRKWLGHAAPEVEPDLACWLGIMRNFATGEQRFDLGRKAQRPTIIGIVQRLDAIGVTRQEEPLALGIPNREGKHTPQVVHHRLALLVVEVQQNLGIRLAAKHPAFGFEAFAEGAIIVDLTVKRHDELTVSARHRLRASLRKIDDRETPMPKPDASVVRNPFALPIRSPRCHVIARAHEFVSIDGICCIMVGEDAVDAAHD